jgi:hypothetical protein
VMSALGHKRTFAVQNGMSALPPKADMCGALGHVCFGPIADIQDFDPHKEKTRDIARALSNVKVSNYSCLIKL